ncbi:MAG TPA: hypothetical protein VLI54_07175 [Bacillota bacterium]|nr:hypothetical protein [Bacillota bacterium]
MYSGTTLTPMSGRVLGAHQKIDRLARTSLKQLLKQDGDFPSTKLILHFEGLNGPDAIKRKSPGQDEPWHFYTPFDDQDLELPRIIEGHYDALVTALRALDETRAAFEAAWLAHAIVDGLTPAHHFPYEERLAELRGENRSTRNSIKGKLLLPGETRRKQVSNNWKMWGPKGLLVSHGFFEFGVAVLLTPLSAQGIAIKEHDIAELHKYGVLELFRIKAKEIAAQGMYDRYQKSGWTPALAMQIRKRLLPAIVHTVLLAWYGAAIDAGLTPKDIR